MRIFYSVLFIVLPLLGIYIAAKDKNLGPMRWIILGFSILWLLGFAGCFYVGENFNRAFS